MSTPLPKLAVLVSFMSAISGAPSAAFQGYVELPYGSTFCLQGTHFLTDPCTGSFMLLQDSGAIDLDPYLCRYVTVDGRDVGVECTVIEPQSILVAPPPCPITFPELWLSAEIPPHVNWMRVTCAVSHDVVRGDLLSLRGGPVTVDLGAVRCLANDVPQQDYWFVTGPTDADLPRPGEAFFYLVRAAGLPDGDLTYGHSSDGRERVASSGDCPL